MGRFGNTVKRAAKAFTVSMGPGEYSTAGKKIVCPHCAGTVFAEGSAQLNTAGMTFLNLDWANESATILTCKNCGLIQWYLKKPAPPGR